MVCAAGARLSGDQAGVDQLRTWLLTVGEPLPTDGGMARAWRTGLLAQQLLARGHDVVWWSSAFDHFGRGARSPVDVAIAVKSGLTVWHLSGVAYRRNVSLARLWNHHQVAARFRSLAAAQPAPDVILTSLPTLELCDAAVAYGSARGIPVALDVRDLWPDVLFDFVPAPLKPLAPYAVPWMGRQLRRAARGATAILGVTDEFVGWGLAHAGRPATPGDRAFAMGYSRQEPSGADKARASAFWDARGLVDGGGPNVCFFGTLGWMFDFDVVFAAAARLAHEAPDVRFVLCGGGEKLPELQRRAASHPNVVIPGPVGQAEVWTLMRRSVAGLAPYRPFRNFDDNLPNKPIEYLSAGLPVIAPELKVIRQLVAGERCGLTYPHGASDSLADAVLTLVRNPELRTAMSARAAMVFADRYVADKVYEDMAIQLECLAGQAPAQGRTS